MAVGLPEFHKFLSKERLIVDCYEGDVNVWEYKCVPIFSTMKFNKSALSMGIHSFIGKQNSFLRRGKVLVSY